MAESKTLSLRAIQKYLEKSAYGGPQISEEVLSATFLYVVIPVYKEENLIHTLESLANCDPSERKVEVILVFNAPATDTEAVSLNKRMKLTIDEWKRGKVLNYELFIMDENDLSRKEAGVGLARKIGMDEACWRALEAKQPDAFIACLDADCTVSDNYFTGIEAFVRKHPSLEAASLYFEHPLMGEEYSEELYDAIIYYELHLRYFKHAMTIVGLPYDRYTVGSSMLVSVNAYAKEGGMNKRKAGEDFYFLQKYLINQSLDELNSVTIYPAPRRSDRVPFGTGRAIMDHQNERRNLRYSYSWRSFVLLKEMIASFKASFPEKPKIAEPFVEFLGEEEWDKQWDRMLAQSKDWDTFSKRFYQWFTPFKLLKFIHFLRDHYFPDDLLVEQVKLLGLSNHFHAKDQLRDLRERDFADSRT